MSGEAARRLYDQSNWLYATANALTDRYILGGFLLYGLGATIWLTVLSRWDVSKAYPLVGLGFVLTAGIGFLAGESVTTIRLVGVLLICAGVALVGQS